MKKRIIGGLATLLLLVAPAWADPEIVAPGAKLEKLSGDFLFAEGLTCDAKGDVFFTDQPNNRILKWSLDGQLSTFKKPAGRANGMYFDKAGNLIACADEREELWSIAPDGVVTVLLKGFEGKIFNGPNDVWVRPDQGMYFTDPFYGRSWWTHTSPPQDSEQVYFLAANHRTLRRVTSDLVKPNGIVGSADGKTLYVADIEADKTYAFDIASDGALSHKREVAPLGSDGMTVDTDGNLYLTGKGVSVFDRNGRQISHIDVPEEWVGNICFGGRDHQTLFIAASTGLYSIRLNTRGANPAK